MLALCGAALLLLLVEGALGQTFTKESYPNPLQDPELCRPRTRSRSFLCDPSQILTPTEANELDAVLASIAEQTRCPCSSFSCAESEHDAHGNGYKVGVAVMRRLSGDSEASRHQDDDKYAAKQKLIQTLNEAKLFTIELHKNWKLGHCHEDVVILYSADDDVVYTVTGGVARKMLDDKMVADISLDARRNNHPTLGFKGLKKIAQDYKSALLGRYVAPPQAIKGRGGAANLHPTCLGFLFTTLLLLVALFNRRLGV
jgi:hypothetical protein